MQTVSYQTLPENLISVNMTSLFRNALPYRRWSQRGVATWRFHTELRADMRTDPDDQIQRVGDWRIALRDVHLVEQGRIELPSCKPSEQVIQPFPVSRVL